MTRRYPSRPGRSRPSLRPSSSASLARWAPSQAWSGVGLTKQVEDFLANSAEKGYKFQLIIRADTKITPALQDVLDAARLEGLEVEIIRSLP